MRRWLPARAALPALLVAGVTVLAVAACSSTVSGSGQLGPRPTGPTRTGSGASPTAPDFTGSGPSGSPPPTASGSVPSGLPTGTGAPPETTCPHIVYPYAHVKFDCITTGLEIGTTPDQVWPVNLSKPVEATWAMSEGAGHWGSAEGQSLEAIALNVRNQMLKEDPPAYGTSPAVATTSSKAATVAGVPAWVLASSFTINPSFREDRQLTVKVEKSWIVALQVGSDDVSLWYVTIPDDVSELWATVPAVLATIATV